MAWIRSIVVAIVAAWTLFAGAAQANDCLGFFAGAEAPKLTQPIPTAAFVELCYPGFVVLHSSATRTPVWSAEVLTRASVTAALKVKRYGDFHSESRLRGAGAVPGDYACTGYDRGHMTPVGDFATGEDMKATFTMANMVPQWPNLNQGLWARIERRLQDVALADGMIYVVTGPLFGPNSQMLHGRVAVPVQTWKAVYDPLRGGAAAYLATNENVAAYRQLSIRELTELTGIDPFPAVPRDVKAIAMTLPPVEKKYIRLRPTGVPPACTR